MTACRLIIDPPQDGAWNMAVDEALLEDAADRGAASLRFYLWSEPTLSLGYFQKFEDRRQHVASFNAPVVRRLSGGGALIHDRELTYSLCLPNTHPLARDASALYALVHRAIIAALADAGVTGAALREESRRSADDREDDEPFLCFARRHESDIVEPDVRRPHAVAKILGSAQRRRRGAVLQHGGVLLAASTLAPSLPGLEELSGIRLDANDLAARSAVSITNSLGLAPCEGELDDRFQSRTSNLAQDKYAQESWTRRR